MFSRRVNLVFGLVFALASTPVFAQEDPVRGAAPGVNDPTEHSNQDGPNPGASSGFTPGPAFAPNEILRLYVRLDNAAGGDGTSWPNAFRSLRTALTVASNWTGRTEIWVARGVYRVEQDPLGRGLGFSIPARTQVFGGFRGNEVRRHQRDAKPETNGTVLSGLISDGVQAQHVVRFENVGRGSALDGFTVEGGSATAAPADGGGVWIWRGAPTIRNVDFLDNRAGGRGGAMFVNGGRPVLSNVRFFDNTADHGGAIALDGGALDAEGCYFQNNTADQNGGAIFAQGSDAVRLRSCDARGNSAANGGAMSIQFVSTLDDFSSVYSGNTAEFGGAIQLLSVADASLVNMTVVNNDAAMGAALRQDGQTFTTIANAIVWHNDPDNVPSLDIGPSSTIDVYSSDVEYWFAGGVFDENLNTSVQPRFRNPVGADGVAGTADDDLRLQRNSPCIDAGSNRWLPFADLLRSPILRRTLLDADGNPRRVDVASVPDTGIGRAPVVDIGAYEVEPDADDGDGTPIGPHPTLP
ncbi:MAG: right-handed parallel beta-helix repeat-containing protein [Phycisphaerales bacterium]|nr:right-handed parallel beta-helix repeat-containing protein [Phycisphaerales bacterium]